MLHVLHSISSELFDIMRAWLCRNLCLAFAAQYLQESARGGSTDMERSGVQGITDEQAALQMGAWAIFAAPLIMGNDVRNLTKAQRNILLNKSVIAINQDPLGTQQPSQLPLQCGVQIMPHCPCKMHLSRCLSC